MLIDRKRSSEFAYNIHSSHFLAKIQYSIPKQKVVESLLVSMLHNDKNTLIRLMGEFFHIIEDTFKLSTIADPLLEDFRLLFSQ